MLVIKLLNIKNNRRMPQRKNLVKIVQLHLYCFPYNAGPHFWTHLNANPTHPGFFMGYKPRNQFQFIQQQAAQQFQLIQPSVDQNSMMLQSNLNVYYNQMTLPGAIIGGRGKFKICSFSPK